MIYRRFAEGIDWDEFRKSTHNAQYVDLPEYRLRLWTPPTGAISSMLAACCVLRRVNRHIVYSCQLEVRPNFQGLGVAKLLDEFKVEFARAQGFKVMLCTVRKDNHAQHKAMNKAAPGWIQLLMGQEDAGIEPSEDTELFGRYL